MTILTFLSLFLQNVYISPILSTTKNLAAYFIVANGSLLTILGLNGKQSVTVNGKGMESFYFTKLPLLVKMYVTVLGITQKCKFFSQLLPV